MSCELETSLVALEQSLAALGTALRDQDAPSIERLSHELQALLGGAVQRFARAAQRPNGVPPALRQRLLRASAQVAAQRESLARATAALDRAIDVLMPSQAPAAAYGANGSFARAARTGSIDA
jgi:hypothetical protein